MTPKEWGRQELDRRIAQLRDECARRGLSYNQVGKLAGIVGPTPWRVIENGERPFADTLFALQRAVLGEGGEDGGALPAVGEAPALYGQEASLLSRFRALDLKGRRAVMRFLGIE